MADITKTFDWMKQYKDFKIETDADHLIYVKYKGEKIVGVYSQTGVTEEVLKKDISDLEKELR